MRKGNHTNPKLQNFFNKYRTFSFEVLTYAPYSELPELEAFYIDLFSNCNFAPAGTAPFLGRKHTKETKEKLRLSSTGRKYGTPSLEVRNLIRKAHLGKPKNKTIHSFKHCTGEEFTGTCRDFLNKYFPASEGICPPKIYAVANKTRNSSKGWRLND